MNPLSKLISAESVSLLPKKQLYAILFFLVGGLLLLLASQSILSETKMIERSIASAQKDLAALAPDRAAMRDYRSQTAKIQASLAFAPALTPAKNFEQLGLHATEKVSTQDLPSLPGFQGSLYELSLSTDAPQKVAQALSTLRASGMRLHSVEINPASRKHARIQLELCSFHRK